MAWRDTMRPIKLFNLDARVLVVIFLILPAPYMPVIVFCGALVVFFGACGYLGISVPDALRIIRRVVAGQRTAFNKNNYRRIRDFGGWAIAIVIGATLLSVPTEATAGFQYIAPEGSTQTKLSRKPESLAAAISRIVPNSSQILYHKTVDPTVPAGRYIPGNMYQDSAQSLLWAHGLTFHETNGEFWVMPRGLQIANFEATLAGSGEVSWSVVKGDTLQETLERWAERVGVTVVRLTDRQWSLNNSVTLNGTFLEVVDRLFFGLGHLPEAPVYQFSDDGRLLSVTHTRQVR